MRIVFFGASTLGFECCKRLLETGQNVVGIFSMPREFNISYAAKPVRNFNFRGFEELAERYHLPLVYVSRRMADPEYLALLDSWKPDFGLAAGWYYMIPRTVRELLPKGVAGIHASLLPKYRGGAPLVWAMIHGERETGVSLFHIDSGIDTGDIIAQARIPIGPQDTIKTIYAQAIRLAVELAVENVPQIAAGKASRRPQDHSLATQFPQRSPEDGLIDWSQDPQRIRDFIRALTKPYPGAFTYINGRRVTIWDADIEADGRGAGGSA